MIKIRQMTDDLYRILVYLRSKLHLGSVMLIGNLQTISVLVYEDFSFILLSKELCIIFSGNNICLSFGIGFQKC